MFFYDGNCFIFACKMSVSLPKQLCAGNGIAGNDSSSHIRRCLFATNGVRIPTTEITPDNNISSGLTQTDKVKAKF